MVPSRTWLVPSFTFVAIALSGCGWSDFSPTGFSDDSVFAAGQSQATRNAVIDPATYAGDVAFLLESDLPTAKGPLPLAVYLGITAESDTRLLVNAFVDLRKLQARLPDVLSGAVEETCERQINLDFRGARAEGDGVRAAGTVQIRLYSCDQAESASANRGGLRLAQTVDAEAVIAARLRGNCIEFVLRDLNLASHGFLGALTNAFFSSDSAREAILDKANSVLSDNPVCPKLPKELEALSPRFYSGGVRMIGDGGVGAQLSGSVDISAPALIELLTAMKDRGVLEGQV